MLKVCLTHDIDRIQKSYQYVTHSLRALKRFDLSGLKNQYKSLLTKGPYWGFDKLIEIENKYDVRSTIFFLNESIKVDPFKLKSYYLSMGRYDIESPKVVDMIRYLDGNGWEIGVHGSYNSYQNLSLLKKEKETLEGIIGHEVRGIRQHHLNLDDNTWKLQKEAGFLYDSTLGYTRDIGFKDDIVAPYRPFDNEFIVFPLPIMDFCLNSHPDRWVKFDEIVDTCIEHNGVLVLNYHQHIFHQPDFPGYADDYIQIIEKCIEKNASFKTMGQYYDQLVNSVDA